MLKASRRSKVRLRMTAMIMMTAALLKVAWEAANPAPPIASALQPVGHSAAPAPPPSLEDTEAQVALERLRDAFRNFPDEDQPTVVREVNARYARTEFTCPLEWTDGVPALSVKDKGPQRPLMAGALNQCAAGVERLRREKDAAAEEREVK